MSMSDNINPVFASDFAKVQDRFFLCKKRNSTTFTDFFDPARWTLFVNTLNRYNADVNIIAFGGDEDSERRMLGFFSMDAPDSFPIQRLRIRHNTKFNKAPRHQDYLGSILGLGFDRGRIGDILIGQSSGIDTGYAEVFVSDDIADYICGQLERVGKVPVMAEIVPEGAEGMVRSAGRETQINIASLRLDAVVAAIFRLSRGQVASLVSGEKVFINWVACTDKGRQVKPGDMVTVRGSGRAKIGEILGSTKKDRLRVGVWVGV